MNFDLSYYFAVFVRRLPYFIVVAALVAAASIATALLLPPVYRSSALLLVESPEIPTQLAAPTVQSQALEKLQTVENRLMTRSNLIDIAKRLKVFPDIKRMSPDEIDLAMRDATNVNKSAGKGQATMMTLAFSGGTGQVAAGVVNEYVTLILKEDSNIRNQNAGETVDFFKQQVDELGARLDEMSSKILDFQNSHSDALPSTLSYRLQQQSALQGKLDASDLNIAQLNDQKQRLIAIFQQTGQVANATGTAQTPEEKQLATLNDQLNQALAVMAPEHPKIKILKAQVAQLEVIVRNQAPASAANPATTAGSSMLDAQISSLDAQIKTAQSQRDQMATQMAKLQDTIDRTPANQVALDALNRDYANVQSQYNNAVTKQAAASAGQVIELQAKGEKISVIDAAAVPTDPVKPNRILIAGGGTAAGIFLGLATVLLMELLNRAVRRPADIIKAFGITPIVSIPYMLTPGETTKRRSLFVASLLVAIMGIPAILYAVHVFYQPLDILLAKVAAKVGIRL